MLDWEQEARVRPDHADGTPRAGSGTAGRTTTTTLPPPPLSVPGQREATMTSATPWLGRKRVAFVPLFRSNAAPPDQIPPDWENTILRRVVYDPRREANGADRSLRAWLRAASSGRADIDPVVLPMQTIDKQVVEPNELEGTARQPVARSRHGRCRAGDAGRPGLGHQCRLLVAGGDGGKQRRVADGADPRPDRLQGPLSLRRTTPIQPPRSIDTFDEMSASSQTHPTAFTKNELGWLDAATSRWPWARPPTTSSSISPSRSRRWRGGWPPSASATTFPT